MPRTWSKSPARIRHEGRVALAAVAIIVAGVLIHGNAAFDPLRSRLQATKYRVGEQDVTKLHYLLLRDGALDVTKTKGLASTLAISPELWRDGLPTISIVSDEQGLYSPKRGIFSNAEEKGRRWERPASMSYFENGRLLYETPVGLRIHGGQSRKGEIKSFQVVFRRSYAGVPRAKAGVFFGSDGPPVQRLVLSNTEKPKRFLNPFAYEIAERVGCITSRHRPVRVVLNGERIPSGYFLIEHQSREFLRHRFGHDDFEWIRLKGNSRPSLSLDLLSSWANVGRAFVNLESVSERFDMENLCAWIFAVSFCDTRDEDQGGYFKDRLEENDVWRCVTWDMDGSFNHGKPVKKHEFDFERIRGLRARLFRRMCENDPAFREYYRKFAERMLQERVPPSEIKALAAQYRTILETGMFDPHTRELHQSLNGAEQFLLERHGRYLAGLDKYYASLK